jgi:UDP-N-acetylmuramoylalanine--D-glutamate ligase
MDYRGQRATIVGLGHFGGGAAAARWLARQGAIVTVTDLADEQTLADALPLLADAPIAAVHLGGHREEDFRDADLIVLNPAVRPNSPWLQVARSSGARLSTELELFIENCPARIIGVTGSNGKSTTAAMTAAILKAAGQRTFLGGNIGGSLLDQLPQIRPDDWVVLEISSFQLWHCSPHTPCAGPANRIRHTPCADPAHGACRIHVAVVTGCSPNHLDWHGTYADYVAAKQRILSGQTPQDFAVLNSLDAEVASWSRLVRGRLIIPSGADIPTCPEQRIRHTPCADPVERIRHTPCADPVERIRHTPCADPVERIRHTPCAEAAHGVCGIRFDLPPLQVPGRHNQINAACAAAAALAVGCRREDVWRGLEGFRGLPQRLEWFAVVDGRRFYNDSTATTPESTIAALESLDLPVWLLAGGKSKGFDFGPLAAKIVGHARGAAFFGSARSELLAQITAHAPSFACIAVETLEEALAWCWSRSRPGEAILLSPACASTDQFLNFRRRGERFVKLVGELAQENCKVIF